MSCDATLSVRVVALVITAVVSWLPQISAGGREGTPGDTGGRGTAQTVRPPESFSDGAL